MIRVKDLSCKAAGAFEIVSAASFKFFDAFTSPSAAMILKSDSKC